MTTVATVCRRPSLASMAVREANEQLTKLLEIDKARPYETYDCLNSGEGKWIHAPDIQDTQSAVSMYRPTMYAWPNGYSNLSEFILLIN